MEELISPWGFIYITTNMVNGKKYIGQRMFKYSWKDYLGSGKLITKAINKYGKENFIKTIVAFAYSKEELNQLEIEFIKDHNAIKNNDYYNISYGGGSPAGLHPSEETKKKMSDSGKIRFFTNEHKEHMSDSAKGKVISLEQRKKTSESMKGNNNPMYGKQLSEDHKNKLSASKKGMHMKFSNSQIIEIREKYATGNYKQIELAKEYSAGMRTISDIINFKRAYKIA